MSETAEIVVLVGEDAGHARALRRAAQQSHATGVALRIVQVWQLTTPAPEGVSARSFSTASAADARARATRWVLDTLGGRAEHIHWILDLVEIPRRSLSPAAGGSA